MITKRRDLFVLLLQFILVLFLVSGCATTPDSGTKPFLFNYLPSGQSVYLKLNIEAVKSFLQDSLPAQGKEGSLTAQLLARTEDLFITVSQAHENGKEIFIAASGKYPAKLLEAGLRKEKSWRKEKGVAEYWVNQETGISFAHPGRNLLFASTSEMPRMLNSLLTGEKKSIPQELKHELEVSDVVFYMPRPGKEDLLPLGGAAKKYPIKTLWITLFSPIEAKGESFKAGGVFVMNSAEDAETFGKLSKILILALLKKGGIENINSKIEGVQVFIDGEDVRIEGISFLKEDLEILLGNSLKEKKFPLLGMGK